MTDPDPGWTIEITIRNQMGPEHYTIVQPIPTEALWTGWSLRSTEYAEMGFVPGTPGGIEGLARVMKKREYRKDRLIYEATRLGRRLAEHMEDAEGWHGQDRADRMNDLMGRSKY